MTKSETNNRRKNFLPKRAIKHKLAVLGVILIATSLIVTLSVELATSSAQSTNVAKPQTQFRFDIAYAYVGNSPLNSSYTAANGANMTVVTKYPSAIEFNITRLPGTQIASCDAEIEVYNVQIATNTGLLESNPYFVGTNYNSSFSNSELSTLFAHVNDMITSKEFSTALIGNFEINWTANTSILSTPIGSVDSYSNAKSSSGLWNAGTPNAISVTVQRIGYVTINNNSVSLYKDPSNNPTSATAQLSNYGNGFLHNNLVSADKLSQMNLFHPNS